MENKLLKVNQENDLAESLLCNASHEKASLAMRRAKKMILVAVPSEVPVQARCQIGL